MHYIIAIKKLSELSGNNAKKEFLAANMTEELKTVFKYTYDTNYVYGIKQIPSPGSVSEDTDYDTTDQLTAIVDLLELLHNRDVTGHAARDTILSVMESLDADHNDLLAKMLVRDLRLGIGRTMINSVLGKNTIEKFELMACHTLNEKTEKNISYPALAQLKCDAARCAIVYDGAEVSFRTRNGKTYQVTNENLIKSATRACTELESKFNCSGVVVDGELWFGRTSMPNLPRSRQESNGLANKLLKGTCSDDDQHFIRITVWDAVPYDDFIAGKSQYKYCSRFGYVAASVQPSIFGKISLVDSTYVNSVDEAYALAAEYMKKGEEGIILKDINSQWEAKRSKYWLKVKAKLQADMRIVSISEGTGRLKGTMGRIEVQSEDGIVTTGVGTGFNDEARNMFWANRKDLIGKIVTVEYNALSESNGNYSLFLPVFIELRDDKDAADTFEKIKEGT